jgi:hypothetical protein
LEALSRKIEGDLYVAVLESEERIRQEYLQKSYQAVGTTARIVVDNIIFLPGAIAAAVSWLLQWV